MIKRGWSVKMSDGDQKTQSAERPMSATNGVSPRIAAAPSRVVRSSDRIAVTAGRIKRKKHQSSVQNSTIIQLIK